MNIDPDAIKELVLVYSELNEEYQKKLLIEAYRLQFMQDQKEQLQKEHKVYKTEDELQQEIKSRSHKMREEAEILMEILKKGSDTDKAALFMMINYLAGRGKAVQESDISITINQRNISMQEYLGKYLANVDYGKAESMMQDFLDKNLRKKE